MRTSTTIPKPTDRPAVATTRWRIDPTRSELAFRVPSLWGLVTINGHFTHYEGTLDLHREPAVELTIEAVSLDTNNSLRDKHLRSGDFFDVATHPQVRFVSDSATLEGERLIVSGRLDVAGQSMPLDVEATVRSLDGELVVDATVDADQFALGMSHGILGMIRTPSELIVHGRLVQDGD